MSREQSRFHLKWPRFGRRPEPPLVDDDDDDGFGDITEVDETNPKYKSDAQIAEEEKRAKEAEAQKRFIDRINEINASRRNGSSSNLTQGQSSIAGTPPTGSNANLVGNIPRADTSSTTASGSSQVPQQPNSIAAPAAIPSHMPGSNTSLGTMGSPEISRKNTASTASLSGVRREDTGLTDATTVSNASGPEFTRPGFDFKRRYMPGPASQSSVAPGANGNSSPPPPMDSRPSSIGSLGTIPEANAIGAALSTDRAGNATGRQATSTPGGPASRPTSTDLGAFPPPPTSNASATPQIAAVGDARNQSATSISTHAPSTSALDYGAAPPIPDKSAERMKRMNVVNAAQRTQVAHLRSAAVARRG
jgi:hypothetical protein